MLVVLGTVEVVELEAVVATEEVDGTKDTVLYTIFIVEHCK